MVRRRRLVKICEVKWSVLRRYVKFDSDCVDMFNFMLFLIYKIEIKIKRLEKRLRS